MLLIFIELLTCSVFYLVYQTLTITFSVVAFLAHITSTVKSARYPSITLQTP